jgi:hypothetical protein
VAVAVRRDGEVPLADVLADLRLRDACDVEERDPTVTEVVRENGGPLEPYGRA